MERTQLLPNRRRGRASRAAVRRRYHRRTLWRTLCCAALAAADWRSLAQPGRPRNEAGLRAYVLDARIETATERLKLEDWEVALPPALLPRSALCGVSCSLCVMLTFGFLLLDAALVGFRWETVLCRSCAAAF